MIIFHISGNIVAEGVLFPTTPVGHGLIIPGKSFSSNVFSHVSFFFSVLQWKTLHFASFRHFAHQIREETASRGLHIFNRFSLQLTTKLRIVFVIYYLNDYTCPCLRHDTHSSSIEKIERGASYVAPTSKHSFLFSVGAVSCQNTAPEVSWGRGFTSAKARSKPAILKKRSIRPDYARKRKCQKCKEVRAAVTAAKKGSPGRPRKACWEKDNTASHTEREKKKMYEAKSENRKKGKWRCKLSFLL